MLEGISVAKLQVSWYNGMPGALQRLCRVPFAGMFWMFCLSCWSAGSLQSTALIFGFGGHGQKGSV